MKKYRWWNRHRCPHVMLAAIHGDEINYLGGYRLACMQCLRLIDGPVWLEATRKTEYDRFMQEMRGD